MIFVRLRLSEQPLKRSLQIKRFWYLVKLGELLTEINVMLCSIWYRLYNFKNAKNSHGGVLICNTLPCVFFTFFKLYEWYQIAQSTTNLANGYSESCMSYKLVVWPFLKIPSSDPANLKRWRTKIVAKLSCIDVCRNLEYAYDTNQVSVSSKTYTLFPPKQQKISLVANTIRVVNSYNHRRAQYPV